MSNPIVHPLTSSLAVASAWLLTLIPTQGLSAQTKPTSKTTAVSESEAYEIAVEAYHYLYPLVLMDVTRKVSTNAAPGARPGCGPTNTFAHCREYPDESFRTVVRPNFDTLYSSAWLDLTNGPVVVTAPDTQGRYYLLPMLDMWSEVFAAPGKRTTGTTAGNWALVPPGWRGELPAGIERIDAPTSHVWVIGRTQTNGQKDYDAVHKIQDGYTITPLASWGKTAKPGPTVFDPSVDIKTDPPQQVQSMTADAFFSYATELLKTNPPHASDWSTVARLSRIGIVRGQVFAPTATVRSVLNRAASDAFETMQTKLPTLARITNGWQINTDTMGSYGNSYLKRAIVAWTGLGANQPEDAIYPIAMTDADGKQILADNNYVLTFAKDELPPAGAFWSVTMYDGDGYPVANEIRRFAIGDRDALKFNPDGSLDIFIQHESPGVDKQANWLPAPAKGKMSITMRLYAPKTKALDGRWNPPPIRRSGPAAAPQGK